MCVSPSVLSNGVTVGCRRCWQCLANRVDDWTGRNIAEMQTSSVSYALRLSYGRSRDGASDHLHSVMLFASDMQKFVKRMRSRTYGYKVRYMIAGEYGSTFGRAHWHGIFHFTGPKLPDWSRDWENWSDEQWQRVGGVHLPEWSYDDGSPIGHVHVKRAQYAHVRYALKYMLKDQLDPQNSVKVLMSKYPPLGTEFLTNYARETARAGLAPRDLFYRFPIVTSAGERKVKDFMMRGKVAELFMEAYIAEWRALYGDAAVPDNELTGVWLRFGRLGLSEHLTMIEVEEKAAAAKFARLEEEALRPRTLPEYFANKPRPDSVGERLDLYQWERKYFGQGQEQRQRREPEFNDALVIDYLTYRYNLTERELWAKPFAELEQLWYNAQRDYLAAFAALKRRGHTSFWQYYDKSRLHK